MKRLARLAWACASAASMFACSKQAPEGHAGTPVADAGNLQASPPAPAPLPMYTRALRGKIDGKLAVVMRLGGTTDALEGTYFYEPSASDLHVKGTLSKSGAVHLDESSGGKVTGAFDGTVDFSGVIRGTWTDAAHTKSLPFSLGVASPAAGGPVNVVMRKIQHETKVKGGTCKIDIAYPEVVSSFELAIEAKVNALLKPQATTTCEGAGTHEIATKVLQNGSGILGVQLSYDDYEATMPHPVYGQSFITIAVPAGTEVKLRDIVTEKADPVIRAALKPQLDKLDKDTRDAVSDALAVDQAGFTVTDKGLLLSAFNTLPHALKGAAAEPFLVAPAALESVRVRPSPVDGLWKR